MDLPNRLQGLYQGGYQWQSELMFGDCDGNQNIRMYTLLEHMVTIASQHCRSYGMTYQEFQAQNTAFVLVRCSYQIHKMPKCFQFLTVQTWVDGIKGPYYQRVVQWVDETGAVVVTCRSDWVIIELDSRNLCKPQHDEALFTTKAPIDLPSCQKVKFVGLTLEPLSTHTVTWSQIDGNGHLHSADYGDILWNALPPRLQGIVPKEIHIEFQKELMLGDTLELSYVEPSPSQCIVVGDYQGACSFKAKICY